LSRISEKKLLVMQVLAKAGEPINAYRIQKEVEKVYGRVHNYTINNLLKALKREGIVEEKVISESKKVYLLPRKDFFCIKPVVVLKRDDTFWATVCPFASSCPGEKNCAFIKKLSTQQSHL